jgi:hypothetical protein
LTYAHTSFKSYVSKLIKKTEWDRSDSVFLMFISKLNKLYIETMFNISFLGKLDLSYISNDGIWNPEYIIILIPML